MRPASNDDQGEELRWNAVQIGFGAFGGSIWLWPERWWPDPRTGSFRRRWRPNPSGDGSALVAVADFDGDGHADVVSGNAGSSDVAILLGNGDGTLPAPLFFDTFESAWSMMIADFDGDGRPDVAASTWTQTGYPGSGGIRVLLGEGDGTLAPAPPSTPACGPSP